MITSIPITYQNIHLSPLDKCKFWIFHFPPLKPIWVSMGGNEKPRMWVSMGGGRGNEKSRICIYPEEVNVSVIFTNYRTTTIIWKIKKGSLPVVQNNIIIRVLKSPIRTTYMVPRGGVIIRRKAIEAPKKWWKTIKRKKIVRNICGKRKTSFENGRNRKSALKSCRKPENTQKTTKSDGKQEKKPQKSRKT